MIGGLSPVNTFAKSVNLSFRQIRGRQGLRRFQVPLLGSERQLAWGSCSENCRLGLQGEMKITFSREEEIKA